MLKKENGKLLDFIKIYNIGTNKRIRRFEMSTYLENLNIIDLLSEKHAKLRKMVIETWIEMGEESVSDTESYMLALVEREKLTVAQLGRIIGISRQGAHKCAKSLIERGYLTMENRNYRGKELLLTDKGIRFCRETLILKEKFEEEIKNNIRLACLLKPKSNITIELLQRERKHRVLSSGYMPKFKFNPSIHKKLIILEKPTLENQRPLEDEILKQLKIDKLNWKLLKNINYKEKITAVFNNDKLIYLEEDDTTQKNYGVIIDIGTTTVVSSLIDINSGKELSVKSMINPQKQYGLDVLTRITYELENKELASKFSIENETLVFDENTEFCDTFQVGFIVALKNDTTKIGVVSFIEEDEFTVNWNNNEESVQTSSDLIILPTTLGVKLIKNDDLLKLWEELSNGKNDSFDLKCLYINDIMINEVPFIKAYKNTDVLVDKRFRRRFSLYRKFGKAQVYRTNLYTISGDDVKLDESRFVYYLLQDNVVYYLGIDLNSTELATYLFKK